MARNLPETSYEIDCDKQQSHGKFFKSVMAQLEGWKVLKTYVAKHGSFYAKMESPAPECLWVNVRFSDHDERSENHTQADIEINTKADTAEQAAGWILEWAK